MISLVINSMFPNIQYVENKKKLMYVYILNQIVIHIYLRYLLKVWADTKLETNIKDIYFCNWNIGPNCSKEI